jgi:hypothetical protein
MKRLYVLFFALSLLLFTSGCAVTSITDTEKTVMASWMGSTKADLIQKWGPPTKIFSDGSGGEIYSYEVTINLGQTAGSVYGSGRSLYYTSPQSRVVTRSRMFYINTSGVLYSWLCQGREGN